MPGVYRVFANYRVDFFLPDQFWCISESPRDSSTEIFIKTNKTDQNNGSVPAHTCVRTLLKYIYSRPMRGSDWKLWSAENASEFQMFSVWKWLPVLWMCENTEAVDGSSDSIVRGSRNRRLAGHEAVTSGVHRVSCNQQISSTPVRIYRHVREPNNCYIMTGIPLQWICVS